MKRQVIPIILASLIMQACAPAALGPALSGPALVDFFRGLEPKRYLAAALDDMQNGAYYADRLDWKTIRSAAFAHAANARGPADTYPAIEAAVTNLTRLDNHSSFFPPAATQAFLGFNKPAWIGLLIVVSTGVVVQVLPASPAERAGIRLGDVVDVIDGQSPAVYVAARAGPGATPPELFGYFFDAIKAAIRHPGSEAATFILQPAEVNFNVQPSGRTLDRVGYLQVTGINALNPFDAAISAYSSKLAGLIGQEDRSASCGWVIDLRQNLGGNVGPMADGLAALIGTQPYASAVGRSRRSDFTAQPAAYRLNHPDPPIAVLTSQLTGSSGELIAIAFRGRSGWRSFGEPSAGATSSTQQYLLNDGAFLNLMVGIDADRTGRTYGGKLQPDEPVAIDWSRYAAPDDPVVVAAVDWLHRQSDCA